MLLGIDSGQTSLKAVIFTEEGRAIGAASRQSHTIANRPHWVERDASSVNDQMCEAIADALHAAAVTGAEIRAIGIVGHGDGLYLVGADGYPSRRAILALDTRAEHVLEVWKQDGSVARGVEATGQQPFAASLAPLARWLIDNEPEVMERTRWLLYCKDWLRFCLTGEVGTDFSEANSSVGALDGRSYSREALDAYGISEIAELLPPPLRATDVAGGVLPDMAARTGLHVGTPVVVGTHDAVASVLGIGASASGSYSALAGTYSVNNLVSARRVIDPRWQARPWIEDDRWVLMGASPASVTNFEWYMRTQMENVLDPIAVANSEVEQALTEDSRMIFHPFLFGSPQGGHASASLLGVQGWHSRRHVLRAVWEGVVFNHRTHLDAFSRSDENRVIRLAGGAAKSFVWAQMFADGLASEVEVTQSDEPGALGGAMLAGVGSGVYSSADEAERACVRLSERYVRDESQLARWRDAYLVYSESVELLSGLWGRLDPGSAR